ncbi:hypothetical protein E2986_12176 [Frieseomelitta varia]|uniref:Uncharacterized protein n=1 Tax=Frieseomelitta varia TaxID=561572 RepID=A0A833RKL5_9HYME|nr:hypothetical protein E2986_12176 [Frieseomelitta varia]
MTLEPTLHICNEIHIQNLKYKNVCLYSRKYWKELFGESITLGHVLFFSLLMCLVGFSVIMESFLLYYNIKDI